VNSKTILLVLLALIMIASLVFTAEMSYSQNSTIDRNPLPAVNNSDISGGSIPINPESLQIILRNDTLEIRTMDNRYFL
jgi:hypothetical protein